MISILRWFVTVVAVIGVLAALWIVGASALWCKGTGMPFAATQYIEALGWWGANWYVNLWLVLAGVVPTIFLSFVAFGLFGALRWSVRNLRRNDPAAVYGNTGWATPKQMTDGGLRLRSKL